MASRIFTPSCWVAVGLTTLLLLVSACAPAPTARVQLLIKKGAAKSAQSKNAAAVGPMSFGLSGFDDSLCYAIHVTAPDLVVSTNDGHACTDNDGPSGLGKVEGMFVFNSTADFEVKIGRARRFDLIGFRKNLRGDISDSYNPNPQGAPADCPRNLRAAVVYEVDPFTSLSKKRIRYYVGATEFHPQELFLATGTRDIVAGENTVTLARVYDSDGLIGKRYHGDCEQNSGAPDGLSYSDASPTYTINASIVPNTPSSTGGTIDSYSISPSLPAGLSFNGSTGVITGTPTNLSSVQTFTVTATNALGSDTTTIALEVLSMLTKKMYVTLATSNGALGGVAGADATCSSDSNKPSGGGTYKAFLVANGGPNPRIACTTSNCSGGAGEHVDWVLAPDTRYERADATLIGITGSTALLPAPLANPVAGNSWTYWTGFDSDSNDWLTAHVSGGDDNTCENWTSSAGSPGLHNGKYGFDYSTSFTAVVQSQDWCDTATHHLLCVEQ